MDHNFQKKKTWRLYVKAEYQSFTESLLIETEVYTFNTIVASVGGSLGLFLGFSFYEYGKRLIDNLSIGRFQSRLSLSKTSASSEVVGNVEENTRRIRGAPRCKIEGAKSKYPKSKKFVQKVKNVNAETIQE